MPSSSLPTENAVVHRMACAPASHVEAFTIKASDFWSIWIAFGLPIQDCIVGFLHSDTTPPPERFPARRADNWWLRSENGVTVEVDFRPVANVKKPTGVAGASLAAGSPHLCRLQMTTPPRNRLRTSSFTIAPGGSRTVSEAADRCGKVARHDASSMTYTG